MFRIQFQMSTDFLVPLMSYNFSLIYNNLIITISIMEVENIYLHINAKT